MRHFLWCGSKEGRGLHWVAWDIVTKSKKAGGLGISRIQEVNSALLVKWAWRYKHEVDSMWRKIVLSIHDGRQKWTSLPLKKDISGCWKKIVNHLDKLVIGGKKTHFWIKGVISNGKDINFWKDVWYGDVPLKDRWPCLYALEKKRSSSVFDRLRADGILVRPTREWNLDATSVGLISEIQDVEVMLSKVVFRGGKDRWQWSADAEGSFSVAKVKDMLQKDTTVQRQQQMRWESWVPSKINILVWRIELDRIPTRLALLQRNLYIPDDSCPLCDAFPESATHLFIQCGFSKSVWEGIWSWCKVRPVAFSEFKDLLKLPDALGKQTKWFKRILRGILMVVCWALWITRNNRVFDRSNAKVIEVVAFVKAMSFLWLKNRSNLDQLEWQDWSKYPMYLL